MLSLLVAGVAGCATTTPASPSLTCPVPSEAALFALENGQVPPPIRGLLARYEIHCDAIAASRGGAGSPGFWGMLGGSAH